MFCCQELAQCDRLRWKENKTDELFYMFSSMIQPPSIYRYDIVGIINLKSYKKPKIDFDSDQIRNQIKYSIHQRMEPKFQCLSCTKKDIELNGDNPTWLYAYGGFNIPLMPNFQQRTTGLARARRNVYAMANLTRWW